MPKTIVGIFCGPGYDYYAAPNAENIDQGYKLLAEQIETKEDKQNPVEIYGYSGSHQREGGSSSPANRG